MLNAASKLVHHHLMMRSFSGLLASGNTEDAMITPASVCVNIRPILKYRVILLVGIKPVLIECVFNDCKVIIRFCAFHLFQKVCGISWVDSR